MSFEDKALIIENKTDHFSWKQTLEDVTVTVPLPENTKGRDIVCTMTPSTLVVIVKGQTVLDGPLNHGIKPGESTWTIEDGCLCILLTKAVRHDSWSCVIQGKDELDPIQKEKIDKQMMLEKFQAENPGFDFSGAEFNGALPANPKTFMDDLRQ